MNKSVIIDYCVFCIWNDAIEYESHIDEERAKRMIAFEFELSENAEIIGYDLTEDLYYVTPSSFVEQWNWLADHKPEHFFDIPKEQRRGR